MSRVAVMSARLPSIRNRPLKDSCRPSTTLSELNSRVLLTTAVVSTSAAMLAVVNAAVLEQAVKAIAVPTAMGMVLRTVAAPREFRMSCAGYRVNDLDECGEGHVTEDREQFMVRR